MAYSAALAERVAQALGDGRKIVAKQMMGGLCFMLKGKMCAGIIGGDLLIRIDPDLKAGLLKRKGCREMAFTGRAMKGFVLVGPEGIRTGKDLGRWLDLALEFNPRAKAAKPRKASA